MSGIAKKVHQSVLDELNAESKAKVEAIRKLSASDNHNRNLQAIIVKKEKELKTENTRWTNASNERDVLQETNKKYRNKIGRLEEKLKKNEEEYFKLHGKVGTKSEKEWQEKTAKLRKKIAQLEEGNLGVIVPAGREVQLKDTVAELEHDLETAKKVIDEMNEREERMQTASKELIKKHNNAVNLKDLYEGQLKDVRKESEEKVKELNQYSSLLTGELRGANYCFTKLVEVMFEQKGDS